MMLRCGSFFRSAIVCMMSSNACNLLIVPLERNRENVPFVADLGF